MREVNDGALVKIGTIGGEVISFRKNESGKIEFLKQTSGSDVIESIIDPMLPKELKDKLGTAWSVETAHANKLKKLYKDGSVGKYTYKALSNDFISNGG